MLDKEDKQDIGGVSNSNVNQAGRDINYYGLKPADIIPLLNEIVSTRIKEYSEIAMATVNKRLDEFGKQLVEEVTEKVIDKTERFTEPSIQYATGEAALGYVKSGDKKQKEDLIDLLIERVKVDEHTTKQNIIDQAIKTLPTLSPKGLSLLTLIVYREIIFSGDKNKYKEWLNSVNPLLEDCKKINSIDMAYLQQSGCTYGVPMIFPHENFERELLRKEDLYFRHDIIGKQYDELLRILGLRKTPHGIIGMKSCDEFLNLYSVIFIDPENRRSFLNLCSSDSLDKLINTLAYSALKDKIIQATKLAHPYTESEVRTFLIEQNPNWEVALNFVLAWKKLT
ncbi:hypothetical protein NG821_11970 [Prevotella cerevisiae]|uniref:Uncharacterized protein n=1 Tax=Segatella cerevisiae TaxID=2053716 RepID=A0ABT1BZM7_9BACT|nr:LPO_1073/Vpar_1526 family protein [Segatella cerevisiae]MCO6026541.1 hypothetical protein [Segatella cerevisiae]